MHIIDPKLTAFVSIGMFLLSAMLFYGALESYVDAGFSDRTLFFGVLGLGVFTWGFSLFIILLKGIKRSIDYKKE